MDQTGTMNRTDTHASLLKELDPSFPSFFDIVILREPLTEASAIGQFHRE
jgi:hypothetical protein